MRVTDDIGHLPVPMGVWEFGVTGNVAGTALNGIHAWTPPRGARGFLFFAVSGGGGGGGGRTGALGTNRGGGGGGASGRLFSLILPALLCPPELFISVGMGGAGGAAGVAGSAGSRSLVTRTAGSPQIGAWSFLLAGQSTSTPGGALGGATGSAAGGTTPTVSTIDDMWWGDLAVFLQNGANAGGAGGLATVGAVGGSVQGMNILVSGGAGGASCHSDNVSFAGGDILGRAGVIFPNGLPGGAAGGGNGAAGFECDTPFMATGGSGGGSNGSGLGGRGGDGATGSGGGGGGGGTTGGAGGRGGDGYLGIVAW